MNPNPLESGNNGTAHFSSKSGAHPEIISPLKKITIPMKFRGVNGATNPSWRTAGVRRPINLRKFNYKSVTETFKVEM